MASPRLRSGSTLVELLIFMVIIAAVSVSLLPLFFSSTEDRLLQQTVAAVEQNGQQLLQTIGYTIRHGERILLPEQPGSGSVLVLQTESGSTNPTIIGTVSGTLLLIRGTAKETISSSQVAVENFRMWNTSASVDRGSILVRFDVSRAIRLQAPRTYRRTFEGTFTLFPDTRKTGNRCGCAVPGCAGASNVVWQVCITGACQTANAQMQCP